MDVELFWILDDIGDAEALVVQERHRHQHDRRPEGQEDRDAVQLDDALPTMVRARAGGHQAEPTCRSSTCGRRKSRAAWQRGDIQATFIWDPVLPKSRRTARCIMTSGEHLPSTGKATFDGYIVNTEVGEGESATSW